MVEDLARALHLSPTVFYMLLFATLVMGSLALGLVLNRIIHHWTRKLANTWGSWFSPCWSHCRSPCCS